MGLRAPQICGGRKFGARGLAIEDTCSQFTFCGGRKKFGDEVAGQGLKVVAATAVACLRAPPNLRRPQI
jgi:hypothetical protein